MPPAFLAPLKYVVGIDIAKDTFVACFGCIDATQELHFGKHEVVELSRTALGRIFLTSWNSPKN